MKYQRIYILAFMLGSGLTASAKVFVAAPGGSSDGVFTIDNPGNVEKAMKRMNPGDTLLLRGGEYMLAESLQCTAKAAAQSQFYVLAYKDEKPVLNAENLKKKPENAIFLMDGEYWLFKDIEVKNARKAGFGVWTGSHNTFINCVSHHNGGSGFHVGVMHADESDPAGAKLNADHQLAAYNTFLNCDSYMNFDWHTRNNTAPGTNADGFAVKLGSGQGNRFIGCRAWKNSDDGWDMYECGAAIELIDCWTWQTGIWTDFVDMFNQKTGLELTEDLFDGNGNGFKIGGTCTSNSKRVCKLKSHGKHLLVNCIAFDNRVGGFDQNNHREGATIINGVAFGNTSNYRFYSSCEPGCNWEFQNCISFDGGKIDGTQNRNISITSDFGNIWYDGKNNCDGESLFYSLDVEDAAAPRQSNGSLPEKFGKRKY